MTDGTKGVPSAMESRRDLVSTIRKGISGKMTLELVSKAEQTLTRLRKWVRAFQAKGRALAKVLWQEEEWQSFCHANQRLKDNWYGEEEKAGGNMK